MISPWVFTKRITEFSDSFPLVYEEYYTHRKCRAHYCHPPKWSVTWFYVLPSWILQTFRCPKAAIFSNIATYAANMLAAMRTYYADCIGRLTAICAANGAHYNDKAHPSDRRPNTFNPQCSQPRDTTTPHVAGALAYTVARCLVSRRHN